jgi:predicted PurR-regulated permease PerM
MISNLKKLSFSTIIPLIIILTILSLGILIPILSMIIFGAILSYYVRYIAKKVRIYIKNDTLSVFLGMIILAVPVILLLYFTFSQFVSIAGSFFGSLQHAATGNSTMNMTQINDAVQNLGLPSNISLNLADTIKTGITQFISYIAGLTVSLVSSIPFLAAQVLILIFSVFYFARDGDKVIQHKRHHS